jgi:hypothetical protein
VGERATDKLAESTLVKAMNGIACVTSNLVHDDATFDFPTMLFHTGVVVLLGK